MFQPRKRTTAVNEAEQAGRVSPSSNHWRDTPRQRRLLGSSPPSPGLAPVTVRQHDLTTVRRKKKWKKNKSRWKAADSLSWLNPVNLHHKINKGLRIVWRLHTNCVFQLFFHCTAAPRVVTSECEISDSSRCVVKLNQQMKRTVVEREM